jgi:profilin
MSWQAYVDVNLVGSGKVTKAAILGKQGGVWATSPGFELSKQEQDSIVNAFKSQEGMTSLQGIGVRLAGEKYFTLQTTDRSVYVKKQADGAALVGTKQCILVAVYCAPIQTTEATPVVEKLADYLVENGY